MPSATKAPVKASKAAVSAAQAEQFRHIAYKGAVPLKSFLGAVALVIAMALVVGGLSANLLVNQRLGQLVTDTGTRVELQAQGRAGALTEWAANMARLGRNIEQADVVRIYTTESARLASPADYPPDAVDPDVAHAVMQQQPYMKEMMTEFVRKNGLNGAQILLPTGQVLLEAGQVPHPLSQTLRADVVKQAAGQVLPMYVTGDTVSLDVVRPIVAIGPDDKGPVVAVLWYSAPVGAKLAQLVAATTLDREGERTALLQHEDNKTEIVGRNALAPLQASFADVLADLGRGGETARVVQPSLVDGTPVFATVRQIPGTPFAVLQEYTAKNALGMMVLYKPGIYLIVGLGMLILASLMLALTLHLMGQRNRTRVKLLGQTMEALVRVVEARDPFLSGHHAKVARLAVAVGNKLELDVGERATLFYAAQLSSVGRMLVPQGVLGKKGKLTDAERAEMEQHINQAVNVLGDIEFDLPIMPVIAQMYEREDGSGHPLGLTASKISRMAKVLGACDAFVAMTSDRAHRKALTKAEALKIMASPAFAPDVTAAIKSERA